MTLICAKHLVQNQYLDTSNEGLICRAGSTWHGGNTWAIKPHCTLGPHPDRVIMGSHCASPLDQTARSPMGEDTAEHLHCGTEAPAAVTEIHKVVASPNFPGDEPLNFEGLP